MARAFPKEDREEGNKLLCIHNDEEFMESLRSHLGDSKREYKVLEANTKDGAMNKIVQKDPDTILSIVSSIESLDELREIRSQRPYIPAILILNEEVETSMEDIPAGISGYMMRKEIVERPEMLLRRIRNAVRRKSTYREREKILDRVSDSFFAVDDEWKFTYVNENAEEVLDTDSEDLIGTNIWDEFSEAENSTFQEKYEEAMETQEPVRFQEYYPPLDTWFRVHAFPSETGLSVYFRDITSHKSRIDRLEDQKQKLNIIDNINSTVQKISSEIINESTQENIEETVIEKLVESNAYKFAWIEETETGVIRTGNLEENMREGLELENNENSSEIEVEEIEIEEFPEIKEMASIPLVSDNKEKGTLRVLTEREEPINSGEKDILAGLGNLITHVITSKERKKKYEALIEDIPNGTVFLFDEDLRYTLAGGENFEKYDLEPEDAIGTRITESDLVSEELKKKLGKAYKAAFDGESSELEGKFQGYALDIHVIPVRDEEGNIFSGMHLTQDITRRKELEEEQERRLEKFSEIVSHDLRNPLNVAKGFLDLAEKSKEKEDFRKVENALESIEGVVESLALITKDREDIEKEEVHLEEVFDEAFTVTDANINYEVEDKVFRSSKKDLVRLLSNLISNSVEHNDEDVYVTVGPLEEGFYYEDDGSGIEDPDKAFNYGYTSSDGQGLGLSIVKRIADLNSWEVNLEESEQGGARFEFIF